LESNSVEAKELVAAHADYVERHGLRVTPRFWMNGVEHRLHSMDTIIREVSDLRSDMVRDPVSENAALDGRESR